MGKFKIRYQRTVRTAQYETLVVGLEEEYDDSYFSRDGAFHDARNVVNKWIREELDRLPKDT